MSQACIPPDDLGRVLGLPADSPERRHLDACARCGALRSTYREFLEDRSVPSGADPREAGVHLRAAFREVARPGGTSPSRSAVAPAGAGSNFPARLRDLARFLSRPLVLAPTAAAVLLAIGLYAGREWTRSETGPDPLRGVERLDHSGAAPIPLLEVTPSGQEGVEFSWRSVPGATSYEVVVMGDDLADLVRVPVAGDTGCVVRWADLRPAPSPGAFLGWQVVAIRDATPVARSPIGALRRP